MRRFESLWVVLVLACLCSLFGYQGQPGRPASAPLFWPACGLQAGPEFTLVMLAHPQCPCTQASMRQLKRLADDGYDNLRIYVVFIKPKGTAANFHLGELWDFCNSLPGVVTVVDENGRVGGSFGSFTSGQTLLYGPDKGLDFAGGITPSRGHEGDSIGLEAIEHCLAQNATVETSAVYGCPLTSDRGDLCHP